MWKNIEKYFYPMYLSLWIFLIFFAFPDSEDSGKLELFLRLLVQGSIPLIAAYIGVKYVFVQQKKHEDDLEILLAANQLILDANLALTNLEGIKANYRNTISNSPKSRFIEVKSVEKVGEKIIVNLNRLASVLKSPIGKDNKWSSLINVQTLFRNYNYLIERWELRNQAHKKMSQNLQSVKTPFGYIIKESEFKKEEVKAQIRDTEYLINFIDQTMQKLNEFLREFPLAVDETVLNQAAKEKVKIFSYDNTIAAYTNTKWCIEVDYVELGKILNISLKEARSIFEDRSLAKQK